ncbi:MAG: hypothetical protein ABI605_02330 [Rhizobacter sp.]
MTFFDLLCIGIALCFVGYAVRRARHAVRSGRTAGFILNPCFYLSGYGFLYLLLGTLISEAGQEMYGFGFSDETRWLSNGLALFYFVIFFAAYVASEDRMLVFRQKIPIKSLAFVRLIGIACFLIAGAILVIHGPTLLGMSSDRNAVYAYFVDNIFYNWRYGTLINFLILVFICECLAAGPDVNPLRIAFLIFLPVLAIELMLGGRAALLKIFLSVFVVSCLKKEQLYLRYLLYSFVVLAGIGLIQRFDIASMDLGQTTLSALGELILTRTTTDLVIENGLSGSGLAYSASTALSLLPGVVNNFLFPDSVNYIDVVARNAERAYGLGGNLVSEAYYYGGLPFALLSPWLVAACMYMLNGARFTRRLPGFIFVLFVILGLQNMMRTSFYDQFPTYLYLVWSYFLFVTLLDSNSTVFRTGGRRPAHRPPPAPAGAA